MNTQPTPDELQAALTRLIEGEAEPHDDEMVTEMLHNRPELRAQLRQQLQLDALLRLEAEPTAEAFVENVAARMRPPVDEASFLQRVSAALPRARPKRSFWRLPLTWSAAAAIVLALSICGYWLIARRGANDDSAQSAQVLTGRVTVGGSATRSIALDTPVRATEATEISLPDTSRVTLEKDAVFALHPAAKGERQATELLEGKGTFKVAKAPGIFWVRTKAGSIKVLGTEFSVELKPASKGEDQNKGEDSMKLSTVLLVVVVSGLVDVNVDGVSYSLTGGQSRAFGEEGKEGGDGEKKVVVKREGGGDGEKKEVVKHEGGGDGDVKEKPKVKPSNDQ